MAEKCITTTTTTTTANIADNQPIRVKNSVVKKRSRLTSLETKTIIETTTTTTKLNAKNISAADASTTSANEIICIKTTTYINRNNNVNSNEILNKENNSTSTTTIIANKNLHKISAEKAAAVTTAALIIKNNEAKLLKTIEIDEGNNRVDDNDDDVNDMDEDNDDCNSAGSSDDLIIPLNSIGDIIREQNDLNSETEVGATRCHHDNIIYLETPVIDDNNMCMVGNHNHTDFEKLSAQPKRLSEEFFSSDDNDDGIIEDLTASPSSSSTTGTIRMNNSKLFKKENSYVASAANAEISNDSSNMIQNVLKSNTLKTNNSDNVTDNLTKTNSNATYNIEDDSSSSSSNVIDIQEESHLTIEQEDDMNDDQEETVDEDKEYVEDEELDDEAPTTSSSMGDANSLVGNENEVVSGINSGTLSSESTVSYYDNDVQSMDAIERRDFEHEQRLTGGILLRTQSLTNSENRLNLDVVKTYQPQHKNSQIDDAVENLSLSENSKNSTTLRDHVSTPTSSRNIQSRVNKSTAKVNLSATLDDVNKNSESAMDNGIKQKVLFKKVQPSTSRTHQITNTYSSAAPSSSKSHYSGTFCKNVSQNNKLTANYTISNETSLSDKSQSSTSSNHSLPNFSRKNSNISLYNSSKENEIQGYSNKNNFSVIEPVAGTSRSHISNLSSSTIAKVDANENDSKSGPDDETDSEVLKNSSSLVAKETKNGSAEASADKCQYYSNAELCKVQNLINLENDSYDILKSKLDRISNYKSHRFSKKIAKQSFNDKLDETNSNNSALPADILQPANEVDEQNEEDLNEDNADEELVNQNNFDGIIENEDLLSNEQQHENDFVDDETWVDCEEGSDEEVCTCYNNNTNTEEDDLPSKDVDLSSYIQMVSLSEEMFFQENATMPAEFGSSIQHQRKRKHNDNILNNSCNISTSESPDNTFHDVASSRKRIALDYASTPRSSNSNNYFSSPSTTTTVSTNLQGNEIRRTPRSIIPTKDNPPPELHDWLTQFQRWSHAERLLAVDRLIEHCEPQQVRHMMKVIEPQFQRDFISLLPRELALQVLSYLEPKDLLRAAQTCRSWRYLCDDNLLWKEKCKSAQISTELKATKNGLMSCEALPKRGRAGNMPPISSPWKAAYMRQHIIEMNWRTRPIRKTKLLKGHDDHVITCLQFSGTRIVSGSDDNTLKVWSAVNGRCLRTLVGHTGGVWSSQMSDNIIISGSTDRTLKVWDMETGQCIHTLLGHTSTVRCMHLHGKKVVSGSRDATLRVWDIEQGSCLHVLVGHLAAVRCVQYDGKLIVSGAYDYMVKIWHPERQECLHTLQGHTNRVYSLQFDGVHVVSGSLDTSIRVWDAETGNLKHTLMGHQSLTSGMELRQNILVSGNADSTVKVWDITTGQCLQTLSGPNKHQSAVTCLQFNSRFVITSSDDGTVKLWDVKTGEFIRNLVALDSGGSGGVVWRIRANDTKLICAVGSRNGTEETKLMVLDFDVEGACVKCS